MKTLLYVVSGHILHSKADKTKGFMVLKDIKQSKLVRFLFVWFVPPTQKGVVRNLPSYSSVQAVLSPAQLVTQVAEASHTACLLYFPVM